MLTGIICPHTLLLVSAGLSVLQTCKLFPDHVSGIFSHSHYEIKTESTRIFSLFQSQEEGEQKKATKTCTHHSISLDSRSLRRSCTSCRQRSWYSGCFARLYRIQERPLAVVSWPEYHPERLGSLGYFSTKGEQHPHSKDHGEIGRDEVAQGPHTKSLGQRDSALSLYSECFARLCRTQERPLAVASWPEGHPELLESLGYFSTRAWTAAGSQHGRSHPWQRS